LEQKMDEELLAAKKARKATTVGERGQDHHQPRQAVYVPIHSDDGGPTTPGMLPPADRSWPSFLSRHRSSSGHVLVVCGDDDNNHNKNNSGSDEALLGFLSCEREQTAALCFWMMAVLTSEVSPDERGRGRALSLLHTASQTLRRVLDRNNDNSNKSGRNGNWNAGTRIDERTFRVCLDLCERIEGEALDLFAPLDRITPGTKRESSSSINNNNGDDDGGTQSKRNSRYGAPASVYQKNSAPWEIATPMRQKRQWTSPRNRIQQSRTEESTTIATKKDLIC